MNSCSPAFSSRDSVFWRTEKVGSSRTLASSLGGFWAVLPGRGSTHKQKETRKRSGIRIMSCRRVSRRLSGRVGVQSFSLSARDSCDCCESCACNTLIADSRLLKAKNYFFRKTWNTFMSFASASLTKTRPVFETAMPAGSKSSAVLNSVMLLPSGANT